MDTTVIFPLDSEMEELSKGFDERHAFNVSYGTSKLKRDIATVSIDKSLNNKKNAAANILHPILTSTIQTSGVLLSPSTGILATRSTHSCTASVMCGTTEVKTRKI